MPAGSSRSLQILVRVGLGVGMNLGCRRSAVLVAGLCCPVMAWAADSVPSGGVLAPATTDWTVTIGVEGRLEPKFQATDHDVLRPYPLFDVRRVGTPERFH